MKNYRDSDYSVNRYSQGIVYRFADKTVEIILEDYLRENPGKTEADFLELKALSDEIYLEQDRAENAQTKKNLSIHGMEETEACATRPLDEEYCENEERQRMMKAVIKLFDEGKMTEKQKQRFIQHFFHGKSFRVIAKEEGVFFTSVAKSIRTASEKLKHYFKDTKK